MGSVTRTELNQQTARVLARVASGESVTITERGRPVAQLVPPARSTWEERLGAGKITRATRSGRPRISKRIAGWTAQELLDDMRDDST